MNPFTWLRQWYRVFRYLKVSEWLMVLPNGDIITQTFEQHANMHPQQPTREQLDNMIEPIRNAIMQLGDYGIYISNWRHAFNLNNLAMNNGLRRNLPTEPNPVQQEILQRFNIDQHGLPLPIPTIPMDAGIRRHADGYYYLYPELSGPYNERGEAVNPNRDPPEPTPDNVPRWHPTEVPLTQEELNNIRRLQPQPTPGHDNMCTLWHNNGIAWITLTSTRSEDEAGSDWLGNFSMSQSDFKRLCNHKNQEAIQKFLAGLDEVDTTNRKSAKRINFIGGK